MVRASLVGLVCVGCYAPTPPAGSPCPTGICPSGLVCTPLTMTCEEEAQDDARPDVGPDVPVVPAGCFGTGIVQVCPDGNITGQDTIVVQTTTTLNTSTSNLCEPYHLANGADDGTFCVIAAKAITVTPAGRWNITGTRPLVLIGQNAIVVDGVIDLASHRDGLAGAGSNPPACIAGQAATGAQGGPGGTFGTGGGDGGGVLAGAKAIAAQPQPVAALRGGCDGGNGAGANIGTGGRGGGAIALISAQAIEISNTINASGAAGTNGGLRSGGGGGGSGGMLVLDAPFVTVSSDARILANGGGGGEAGGGSNPGRDGSDPDPAAPLSPASGGAGGAGGGGDGGDGAAGALEGEDGANSPDDNGGGGGGGGAHGVIRVFPSQNLGGVISPQPQ